jgi:hypothetical protein
LIENKYLSRKIRRGWLFSATNACVAIYIFYESSNQLKRAINIRCMHLQSRIKSLKHLHLIFCFNELSIKSDRIGDVMVSLLASSAVDRGFEPRSDQTKDYKIGMCCFCAKHAALRRKSKDWSARNQNNVSEWSDMSTRGLVSVSKHYKNPTQRVGLVQSGLHHHLIEN